MNKKKLSALVLLGISSAAGIGTLNADSAPSSTMQQPSTMTPEEQAFAAKLDQHGSQQFKNMSEEQRTMCMQIASHGCKGKNACKGQGNCKTPKNMCAGANGCKGQGGCKVSPSRAVKIVNDGMAQKRLAAL